MTPTVYCSACQKALRRHQRRGRAGPPLTREGESGPQRADRRLHLGKLDRLPEALKEASLERERAVPPEVRRQLDGRPSRTPKPDS